jgi:hypothetical protein
MSREYVVSDKFGRKSTILGTLGARSYYINNQSLFNSYLIVLSILMLFSPLFFFVTLIYFYLAYKTIFIDMFFKNKQIESKYKEILSPMVARELFSSIGYRVYPEELDEHLYLVNTDNKDGIKELVNNAI